MTAPKQRRISHGALGRGAHSESKRLARGLGWFSIGLGLTELFAARLLCQGLGLKGHEPLVRTYGAREIATGIAILASHDPTPWIWGRVGGDALDLGTLAAGFHDNPQTENLMLATVAVAGVTALDVVCARGLTSDKQLVPAGKYNYRGRSGFPRAPAMMRGAASDFEAPQDFKIPELLSPWNGDRASSETVSATSMAGLT
jgi:hypothetical protein